MSWQQSSFIAMAMASLTIVAVPASAQFTLAPGDPLVPTGLGAGDSFHFVFVSGNKIQSDLIDGTDDSTDNSTVAQWNSWVNSQADASSITTFGNINWSAIVSVKGATTAANIDARDNAVVTAAVYRTDKEPVATGASHFWDASTTALTNPILFDENAGAINTAGGSGAGRLVWTGSDSDGTINSTYPLSNGTGDGRTGTSPSTSGPWIAQGTHERRGPNTPLRVYALSELISIVNPFSMEATATAGNWTITNGDSNNGEFIAAGDPGSFSGLNTLALDETATDLGPFDVQVTVDGPFDDGTETVGISKSVTNDSDFDWSSFGIQLGTGLGDEFEALTDSDLLAFLGTPSPEETTGAFPDFTLEDDLLLFSGLLEQGATAEFNFALNVPEDFSTFTMRQFAVQTPEPASIAIWMLLSLALGGYGYYRARRQS